MHALHSGRSLHLESICSSCEALQLLVVENEWTDSSVRTDVSTLVTLDTVVLVPNRNEGLNTALLVSGCTNLPRTVDCAVLNKIRNLQQVASLSVDRTNQLLNECGCVVGLNLIIRQVSPLRLNGQLYILATTIDSGIVLINNVLTLSTVRLQGSSLHLLNSELYGDHLGDAEEGRLKDGVGTVAQTNLLCNLGSVDSIDSDVVLSEVALYLVRHELLQLGIVEDGVQQECTVLLQTTGHIIHVQVSLHVASHEVRCGHQIGRTDRRVTETQVRAGETARLLRVVREVSLAVLVGVVTNKFGYII